MAKNSAIFGNFPTGKNSNNKPTRITTNNNAKVVKSGNTRGTSVGYNRPTRHSNDHYSKPEPQAGEDE